MALSTHAGRPRGGQRRRSLLLSLLALSLLVAGCSAGKAFVVVDRQPAKISYGELSEVFGDLDTEGGRGEAAMSLLEGRREKILPLLDKIGEAFGTASAASSRTCGVASDAAEPTRKSSAPHRGQGNPLGFLEVTGIPSEMAELRERLLPRASHLANLPRSELEQLERPDTGYSVGWSHGREAFRSTTTSSSDDDGDGETDTPSQTKRYDTAKGSFYLDPFVTGSANANVFPPSLQPRLEAELLRMTRFMSRVGLWIALLCDYYLLVYGDKRDGNDTVDGTGFQTDGVDEELMVYKSLVSGMPAAKARLLYYFPRQHLQQQQQEQLQQRDSLAAKGDDNNDDDDDNVFDDWCGWHTDHGSLTALLPGMLCGDGDDDAVLHSHSQPHSQPPIDSSIERRGSGPSSPRRRAGLYIRATGGARPCAPGSGPSELVRVDLRADSLGFQLGETLEILSRGRFRATPHAVKAPGAASAARGRASLALFLQPLPGTVLPPLAVLPPGNGNGDSTAADPFSLASRWRGTFGEFQAATIASFG